MAASWRTLALVMLAASQLSAAPADHPASELVGEWRGTSVCTDLVVAPACHDEVVVYEFTAGAPPGTVHWKADKIVDGKREPMGELDVVYDPGDACWRAEFRSPRVHVVFCLEVSGSQLTGSAWLFPGKQKVRKIDARRP
jgi:hypothetical protein